MNFENVNNFFRKLTMINVTYKMIMKNNLISMERVENKMNHTRKNNTNVGMLRTFMPFYTHILCLIHTFIIYFES